MSRIVLIPRLPEDLTLDFVFQTESGVAVQASDEEIRVLRDRGIAVVDLFASGNAYAAAVHNLNEAEAVAAIESVQSTALAALSPPERSQFGVA